MSTHRHIDKICCVFLVLAIAVTVLFINSESFGIQHAKAVMGYEEKLFDTSVVHTIDIVMDDFDTFIESCTSEEYSVCTVVIDNEAYKNVAIRAKGNTSLSSVKSYGNDRYSFKIEFDHYDSTKSYYGLDKLCLNNVIQDNTYMKDYLTYTMMYEFGVNAPLCSYVYITVNGEDWGLYLAVEGVEESFLRRNYGNNGGELYKPDSMDMGGGRGNGKGFDISDIEDFADGVQQSPENTMSDSASEGAQSGRGFAPGNMQRPDSGGFPEGEMAMPGGIFSQSGENDQQKTNGFGNDMSGRGSSDVSLIYTDDDYDSYQNIFDNAKTDINDSDRDRLIAAIKRLNENEAIESTVNIDQVMRYFTVHNFVLNFDSYTGSMIHNYYLYESNGVLTMIPWDYNLAFGGFQSASDAESLVNYPIDTPVSGGTVDSRPMLAWIFNSEEYTELYHEYFTDFISDYFENGHFETLIHTVTELISPYVEKDPTKFCTYEEFREGAGTLKKFCLLRAESVKGQLSGEIASDEEGQKQDSSSFIEASGISVSVMGSMGNTMGRGDFGEDTNERSETLQSEQGKNAAAMQPLEMPAGTAGEKNTADGQLPAQENKNVTAGSMPQDSVNAPSGVQEEGVGVAEQSDNNMMTLPPDGAQMPGNMQGGLEMPDNVGANGAFSDAEMSGDADISNFSEGVSVPDSKPTSSNMPLILLSVSILVLVLGLASVTVYKIR